MKLIEDGTYVVDVSEADLDKIKRVMLDTGKHCILMYPDEPKIIRCKDCKYWEYDVIFKDGWCRGKQQGDPNWFCADGERRE